MEPYRRDPFVNTKEEQVKAGKKSSHPVQPFEVACGTRISIGLSGRPKRHKGVCRYAQNIRDTFHMEQMKSHRPDVRYMQRQQ